MQVVADFRASQTYGNKEMNNNTSMTVRRAAEACSRMINANNQVQDSSINRN